MTTNEFGEIHEAWADIRTIYDEIAVLNADAAYITAFGAQSAQTAAAQ